MSDTATQAPTHEVILTDVAATKVKSLLAQEGRDDLRLRIAVQPGGCSGLIGGGRGRAALASRQGQSDEQGSESCEGR